MSSDFHFLVSGSHISKEPNDKSLFHFQRHEGAKKTLEQIEQLQKNHINPVIDGDLTLMEVARIIKKGHDVKYTQNKDILTTQIEDFCLSCLGLQTSEQKHTEISQIFSRIQENLFRQDEKKTYLINGIKINRSQVDEQTTVFSNLHHDQSSHVGFELEDEALVPLIQNPERMTFAECLKQYPKIEHLINKDNALNLYLMAQFYDVKGLMQECGEILKQDLRNKINALKTVEVLGFLEEHHKEFAKSGIEDKHFFDDEIIQSLEQKGYGGIPLEDRISILKSDFIKTLAKENPEFAKKLALMCFKPESMHYKNELYSSGDYELKSHGSPIECYEMIAGLEIPELYDVFLQSTRLYSQNEKKELADYALKNKIPELFLTINRNAITVSNSNKVLVFVENVPEGWNLMISLNF